MAQSSTRRGADFYLLAGFFALFVIFLYGPMLMIFILSFQGPTGGLTFPMRGVSTHWFQDLWSSSRYGDLGGAFRRSLGLGVLSLAVTAVVCLFAGLAFRRRFWGAGPIFYLSIISQAMTFALLLAFFRNDMGFGGNNGLTDFKDLLGFSLSQDSTRVGLFLASAIALGLGYLACRFIVTSRLGRVVVAIRDAESRTRFCGYQVERYKVWVYVFAAMLAVSYTHLTLPTSDLV